MDFDNKKKLTKQDLSHLEGHRLKTRRDFLSHGLISMSASIMAPSLLGMLSMKRAFGNECGAMMEMATNQRTPIIIFDLAGGANFAGSSIIVGGAGGQQDYLNSYGELGLPPDMHPTRAGMMSNELGLLHHGDSPYLRGIRNVTSAEVRSRVDGGIFCARSNDDTANNPHNPMYWLNKAGAQGELAQLLGTSNSVSGGRSVAPTLSINPAIAPVTINRPEDVLGLVNVGKLNQLFSNEKAERIMKSIERLSDMRIRQISAQSLPEQIKTLVRCGYIQSQDMLNKYSANNLDPRLDPDVAATFNNLGNNDQRRTASIAKMVLDGYAGTGTITKGGYDYHNNTRRTGEIRDFEAGELIGRVLALAARKNKNVMIYVLTDGGCSTRPVIDNTEGGRGKYNWTGDSSVRSSSFMFVYRHAGRATLRRPEGRQIGHFLQNGAVNREATLISNNVNNLAKAVVANYLALHGEEGRLAQVVGDNPFGSNLEQYLFFNRIV
jgi:hypothetical protein